MPDHAGCAHVYGCFDGRGIGGAIRGQLAAVEGALTRPIR